MKRFTQNGIRRFSTELRPEPILKHVTHVKFPIEDDFKTMFVNCDYRKWGVKCWWCSVNDDPPWCVDVVMVCDDEMKQKD